MCLDWETILSGFAQLQKVSFQKLLLRDSAFACFEIQKLLLLLQSFLNTVRLVQLVEHQIVVLGVVGSSPTSHPKTGPLESRSFLFKSHALGRAY